VSIMRKNRGHLQLLPFSSLYLERASSSPLALNKTTVSLTAARKNQF